MRDPLPRSFYDRPTEVVARDLIGCLLIRITTEGPVGGVIVETEAYGPDDEASHAFRGKTARNATMFGPPGLAYVYRIYGAHWCLNAVTGGEGRGEAVLIRALQPTTGLEMMRRNRGIEEEVRLCRGPGSLCRALGVTGDLNGAGFFGPDLIITCENPPVLTVLAGPRIGITKATERQWRFFAAGSPFVSGPRRFAQSGGR